MKTQIIRLYGIVQGVGFRPFVSRLADSIGIKGTVSNKGSYVEIFAQGTEKMLSCFDTKLKEEAPERSEILSMDIKYTDQKEYESFEITESEKQVGDIFVSPDIAICPKCRAELFDEKNRRYLHPFINCTQCGPRLTILDAMPYDRERTSMKEFPMCESCHEEYVNPQTRRYDAQPVCCNECGPKIYIVGSDTKGGEAITAVRKAIMEGKICGVKGIGGFHLCCNAADEKAVSRLRELKHRPAKPFAVMMKNLGVCESQCEILGGQREMLDGWQKPIMLLKKKSLTKFCESCAPNNSSIGVMLPYAPLHELLFNYPDSIEMTDCLVMTSGNVSGAPICRTDEDAVNEISDYCDLILSHDRKIRIRADDSVMDWYDGKPYMIRRSRGFAPLPTILSGKFKGQVLAIGGELKNTFCIAKDNLFYLSSYVGDMADIRTVYALKQSVERMEGLLEAKPEIVVCDMHPKYNTVAVAEEMGLPIMKIQHHYAHILSCMAENDYCGEVIGIALDGTGYGLDNTIWGGEILRASYEKFERLGSIKPFIQVGGDMSSKEGWRIAVSMLHGIYGNGAKICKQLDLCDEKVYNIQAAMADKKVNSIVSTSCGRLFDGVSAILGIRKSSTFEGEASMALQFAAESYGESNPTADIEEMDKLIRCEEKITLCTGALIKRIAEKKLSGENSDKLAWEFHKLLSDMICEAAEEAKKRTGLNVCALSGGVFQNKLLLNMCKAGLEKKGFKVLLHSLVPANDGGISLGQAAAAMYKLQLETQKK